MTEGEVVTSSYSLPQQFASTSHTAVSSSEEQIFDQQLLCELISHIQELMPGYTPSAQTILNAISMAQLQVLQISSQTNLDESSHSYNLMQLIAYWLAYIESRGQEAAATFYNNSVHGQYFAEHSSLAHQQQAMTNLQNIPNLLSLFTASSNNYTLSQAYNSLSAMGEGGYDVYQFDSHGMLIIYFSNGIYTIITPFNRIMLAENARQAVQQLAALLRYRFPLDWLRANSRIAVSYTACGGVIGFFASIPMAVMSRFFVGFSLRDAMYTVALWGGFGGILGFLASIRVMSTDAVEIKDDL